MSDPHASSNRESLEHHIINSWRIPDTCLDFSLLSYYKLIVWDRHDFESRSWRGFIVKDCEIFQIIPFRRSYEDPQTLTKTILSFRKILGHSTGFVMYKHVTPNHPEIGV